MCHYMVEEIKEEKRKKFYAETNWYKSNYESLGAGWLQRSLDKLDLKQNYVFVSLSANAAYYEYDAYRSHQVTFDPFYYVGDFYADTLKDKPVESFAKFKYIKGKSDAADSKTYLKIPKKADVILDCKGALWYHLLDAKPETEKLLRHYISLLADDGKLLIDRYNHNFKYYLNLLRFYYFDRADNECKSDLSYFAERSTYELLKKKMKHNKIKRSIISNITIKLNVAQKNKEKPLSGKMNAAYISKENLSLLLEEMKTWGAATS